MGGARPGRVSRLLQRRQPAHGVRRWAWFGVLAALGMLGKYTTALFLLPLLLLAVLHPRLRRVWAGPGPWLALAVALLLLLPHLLGLWRIDFAPLLFPFERAPGPTHWYDHIVNPLLFAVAQFGDIAAALLALALLAWRRPGEPLAMPGPTPLPPEQRAYLATITWAPFGLAVAASVILGLHLKDMWGYPMWCFIGLFLMAEVVGPFTAGGRQRFAVAWLIILITVPVVFTVQQTIGGAFPAQAVARRSSPARSWRGWWSSAGMPWPVTSGCRSWRAMSGSPATSRSTGPTVRPCSSMPIRPGVPGSRRGRWRGRGPC